MLPSWVIRLSKRRSTRSVADQLQIGRTACPRWVPWDPCVSPPGTSIRSSSACRGFLPWLDERRPDVVCLQETKLADDALAEVLGDELADRGYEVAAHGEATWNGVAILSRVGLEDVVKGIEGGPGFPHQEARAMSATCGGIRVVSVYVPNGREPGSEHYQYKLAWLAALKEMVAAGPEDVIVAGDMNIAPTDDDVFDPEAYIGQTHVTPPGARGAGRAAGPRPARRRARSLAGRARLQLLGLPRRHVPPGPRHAHRPDPRQRAGGRPRARRRGSTVRRARAPGPATTRP